ncbi:hypothetical protein AYO38_01605 [bacterium SCGC AG-212-C10]|nr:hypothetical protein AYO38_01605 [bacterium SCGC AG-212-C10]
MLPVAVKLVALDIDGTIVRPGEDVPSPRLTAAVGALQSAGVVVVLASGRMFPGTAAVARHLGLHAPVICQQGCSVHTLDGGIIHEFPIDHAAALRVVGYARVLDRAYEWFNPVRYIVSREGPATAEYGRVSGITVECMDYPERSGLPATGVGIISTRVEAPEIHRALVRQFGETLHLLDFPEVTVAVAPDANKGHALSLICADFGIERADVVAIGDSVNDAAMLAWARRGIALAHSDAYAMDAADEVLAENDGEPVAEFLEDLLRLV